MAEAGGRGAVELFAHRRVGDGDERAGAFDEALASELGDAVLRDDVLDHVSGSHDSCTLSEDRLDLRDTLLRHGWDGYECLAAFGEGTTVHEVMLAADTRDDTCADRVRTHLTCEINLYCRVYGHDLWILSYAERSIGPCHILKHQVFTIVHIFIQTLRA